MSRRLLSLQNALSAIQGPFINCLCGSNLRITIDLRIKMEQNLCVGGV